MKKKNKPIDIDSKIKFAETIRGQYILGQALDIAIEFLTYLEKIKSPLAEPSNRSDMEYLLGAFPLHRIYKDTLEKNGIKVTDIIKIITNQKTKN